MQISLGTIIMDIHDNMKQAWSCMLANLKMICRFYAHPVNQNSVDMFGPKYVGDDFRRVETRVHSTYANILKNIYRKVKQIVGIGAIG
jgi:hypothetical protein